MYASASLRAALVAALLAGFTPVSGFAQQLPRMPSLPRLPRPQPRPPQPQAQPQAAQQPAGQPLNAKLDETLMGPRSQRVSLSEDGKHIGIITPKGSREVVLLDGVEGPVFDEIPRSSVFGTPEVQWSPTGGHSGYIGRRGGDFIAVIDGKEAGTLLMTAQS